RFPSHSAPYYVFLLLPIPLQPPISPLFPYTTLFRSSDHVAGANAPRLPLAGHGCSWTNRARCCGSLARASVGDANARAKKASGRDRKSTRLNSSHSQISYAVFCLKKKKKTKQKNRYY